VLAREGSSFARLRDVESQLTSWVGEITQRCLVQRCIREVQPEVIFHLAGNTAVRRFKGDWLQVERAIADNFLGTMEVVRAAAESGATIGAFIRTGGLEEYGAGPSPYVETQREQPRSPYSASQVSTTHWCQMLQPQLPFAVITLRPALIYGPAQSRDFLIPALITALLQRKPFAMTDGAQCRDLLYVADFVDAVICAATTDSDLRGAVLNVSTGEEHSMHDVAASIARQLHAEKLIEYGTIPGRSSELMHLVASNDQARRFLGWEPVTHLDVGLARTIAWYREHGERA
jgi:nucleoside-diphosphate-sugar epimerase